MVLHVGEPLPNLVRDHPTDLANRQFLGNHRSPPPQAQKGSLESILFYANSPKPAASH